PCSVAAILLRRRSRSAYWQSTSEDQIMSKAVEPILLLGRHRFSEST
ncbi:hypothetical protein LINPERPRIM_LOCUS39250, partial [Linum perenne]